jgi:hypothetical protein
MGPPRGYASNPVLNHKPVVVQTDPPGQHSRIEERLCACVRACVWVVGYVMLD